MEGNELEELIDGFWNRIFNYVLGLGFSFQICMYYVLLKNYSTKEKV